MDYQEWAPRSEEPPRRRDVDPSDAGSDRSAGLGGRGPARDYSDHGYWGDRRSDRASVGLPAAPPTAGVPMVEAWPSNDIARTSWRDGRGDEPSRQMVPVASAHELLSKPPAPPLGVFDDDDRDYPAVLWWTAIWYAVPLGLYVAISLTRSGTPQTDCATASGGTCASPRSHALNALWGHAFGLVIAIVLSLAVAALIRRVSLGWRAISVGFAAAVIGSGIATLIITRA